MTENKRFKLDFDENVFIDEYEKGELKRSYTIINGKMKEYQLQEIVDLLNKLNNENEGLKQAYVKLKHYHSNLHDECIELECDKDRYYKDVLTLEKENEKLKKENKELQLTNNFWKEQCSHRANEHKHHYSINHCRCTADDFIHELTKGYKGLQKENEKLKQENYDIKHTLEELYYTYIYEPSENYDEEALGQITNLLLKEEEGE